MTGVRWEGRLVRWVAVPLAVLALWASGPMWVRSLGAISHPFQLDPIEGKILQQALWLQQGEPIYFPLGPEPPWVVGNYTPLFPYLCSLGVNSNLPDFTWPRILTLLSTLTVGLAMAATGWFATRRLFPALLAAGLWWSTYEVFNWTALCRVDLPALAFSAAGLAVGVAALGRWSWWRVLGVCALFWLAWLTRQTQGLLPLALIAVAVWQDRRWGLRLAAVWAGGFAALLLALLAITQGVFWTTAFVYNVNQWSSWQLGVWLRHFLLTTSPAAVLALIVGLIALPMCRAKDAVGQGRPGALAVVLIALLLNGVNIAMLGKAGADKNYLLEPMMCLFLAVPLLWVRLGESAMTPSLSTATRIALRGAFVAVTAFLILQTFLQVANPRMAIRPWHLGMFPNRSHWNHPLSNRDRAVDNYLSSVVLQAEGPALCEFSQFALRCGKPMIWEPFLLSQLAEEGRWDQTPLLERVRNREFGVILVMDDLANDADDAVYFSATREFAAAVRETYVLEGTYPGVATQHLWVPRADAGDQPPG